MDETNVLQNLVRVGVVTAVNPDSRTARVLFESSDGMSSEWLAVLDSHPHIPAYDPAPQQTEIAGPAGAGAAEFEAHVHPVVVLPWLPNVGDRVVTLFLPVENAHGFVLGAYQPWQ